MGRKITLILAALIVAAISAGCTSRGVMIRKLAEPYHTLTPSEERMYKGFIRREAPSEAAFLAVQRLSEPYLRDQQWEEAVEVYHTYRSRFEPMDRRFAAIIGLLESASEDLIITNLGEGINSAAHEAIPVPTADGRFLYFTGRERPDCLGGEDVFRSELHLQRWQNAGNLGSDINTVFHESVNSVSADGNRLMLFGNYQGSLGSGDNFFSERTRTGWGIIQHFPRPINSVYFDSDGFETPDGRALLFTSDRPGNVGSFHKKDELFHGNYWGNTDIYVSVRTDTGWSDPVNLGPAINTPFAERTPFLHPDGKTLYFSSDGHYGLGSLDVFVSTRLSDTSWTRWSRPVNLGKQINGPGDDWGYKISTSGDVAYFAASGVVSGFGGYDIYSITLPSAVRPQAVATVSGTVTDNQGMVLEAAIKWENLATGEVMGELRSNPEDGSYFIVLPLGSNYGYYAEREGYYSISENIDLSDSTSSLDLTEDIVMVKVEAIQEGVAVRINNIFFDFDRSNLKPESYPELSRLAEFLQSDPRARVEISGHTDNVGTHQYNLELSLARAGAVVDYLASAGIDSSRLISEGYGESQPVASNETDQGRALNRRVEFRFVK